MSLRKKAVRTIRRVAGDDSKIETTLRAARDRAAYRSGALSKQTTAVVFRGDDTKFGIFGFGGCDVWAIAESGAELRKATTASGATWAAGRAQFTRSDLILQAYDGIDPELTAEVSERLQLEKPMFKPVLFEPEFLVPGHERLGPYPKNVIVLTISTDLVRTMYRHREHGYLVDPGGFWLASARDRWTTTGVVDPTGQSGSFLGHQFEIRLRWQILRSLILLEAGYAHLFDGEFMQQAPNAVKQGDTDYVYTQAVFRF